LFDVQSWKGIRSKAMPTENGDGEGDEDESEEGEEKE
jgi:hypothetical protein